MADSWTSSISHIRTSNIEATRAGLCRLYGDATIRIEGNFEWHAVVSIMGPLTLVQGALDNVAHLNVTGLRHTLLVTRTNSVQFSTAKGLGATIPGAKAALFSPGARASFKLDPAMRSSNFIFDSKFLEGQFAALTGEVIRDDIDFENALELHTPLGGFINGLCHYLGESITGETKSMHPALVSNLVESLSRALLFSQPHSFSHLLEAPAPPSSRTVVRMVEEYVDAHAGGPIVATDLARVTGASVQSIESAFLEHRQTSPLSFLRQRRLERAHRLLLENPSVSITHAAQVAGYLRVESFEAAYFKAFHEMPMQTRHLGFVGGKSRGSGQIPQTPADRLTLLSDRERDVCALVVRGMNNKQIAVELNIGERTVQRHRERAMNKLGIDSTADLVRLWERKGK